VPQYIDVFLLI